VYYNRPFFASGKVKRVISERLAMRITGGQWKGRNIKVPHNIRPTTSRSKEVLFALISAWIDEADVIDLFCGSGALGLESLSRGARHVFFVDRSNQSIMAVRDNTEMMGIMELSTIIQGDAYVILKKLSSHGHRVNLILADPPYGLRLTQRLVRTVSETGILTPQGILAVEFRKGEVLSDYDSLRLLRTRVLGDTGLAIWEQV
jgi:16S rRNA (guanine966-N2)-methyltransferase